MLGLFYLVWMLLQVMTDFDINPYLPPLMIWYKVILSYLPNPSSRAGYDTRLIFKRSLTGLNSQFSFS